MLNSCNEKKTLWGSACLWDAFSLPSSAADASVSHNQLKAKSESQPVFEANCLNNRQHVTIWDSSWTSCSYRLSMKATRNPETGECDYSCKEKLNVNKQGCLLCHVKQWSTWKHKKVDKFLSSWHINPCCAKCLLSLLISRAKSHMPLLSPRPILRTVNRQ